MTTTYIEFKKENSKKLNDFIGKYFVFAFGQKQYETKLKELGLTEEEFQEKYVGYLGGAIPKDKVAEYRAIGDEMTKNMREKLFSDYEFAKSAFRYELANYEVYYSSRFTEVFSALGLTQEDLVQNPTLNNAFKIAKHKYFEWCNENC